MSAIGTSGHVVLRAHVRFVPIADIHNRQAKVRFQGLPLTECCERCSAGFR